MGLSRAALLAIIRRNVEEPTAGFWTDDDIYRYLNQSIRYINRRTLYMVDDAATTITLVDGTRAYDLADDCPGPERIVYLCDSTGRPIRAISFGTSRNNDTMDFVDEKTTDNPSYFYKVGKQIAFYPIPGAAKTLYYWYLQTPATLSGTVDSPFSEELDDLVQWYASWLALMDKNEYNPKTAHYKALFDESIQQWNDILAVYLSGARKNMNIDGIWMWDSRSTGVK